MLATAAFALDPQKGITQFSHRKWSAADGIGWVGAITQTTDGYLWVAAANGLFKYDGITFTRWEPLPGEPPFPGIPTDFCAGRDGSLWMRFKNSDRIARIKDGHFSMFGPADGLPGQQTTDIFEGPDGTIWAGSEIGLSRYTGGQWERLGEAQGLPEGGLVSHCLARNGSLWLLVGTAKHRPPCELLTLLPGETRFRLAEGRVYPGNTIAEAPDGRFWFSEVMRSVHAFLPKRETLEFVPPEIHVGSSDLLFDRDGGLWIATIGDGLRRARNTATLGEADIPQFGDAVDHYTQKDGLSGDYVECVFEDREGNIWAGTSAGLDCFRECAITALSVREGLPFDQNLLVLGATDGSVWLGATPAGFAQLSRGESRFVPRSWLDLKSHPGDPMPIILSVSGLFEGPPGELFLGTGFGLARFHQGEARLLDSQLAGQLRDIHHLVRDGAGKLWLKDDVHGVFIWDGHQLDRPPISQLSIEAGKSAKALYADSAGRIWFGLSNGAVICMEGGVSRQYTTTDGLFGGEVRTIFSDARGQLWFAGSGGLCRFHDGRFQTLNRRQGLPEDDLSAVLIDDEGDFWLAGLVGIFRVKAAELDRAFQPESGPLRGEYFDSQDGLRGYLGFRNMGRSSAAKSTDGRLWFTTNVGVAMIDPRHLPRNTLPPPVRIQKMIAAGQEHTTFDHLTFPAGTRDCEFQYAALSFVNTGKVRYQYQLKGYDRGWVDAGARHVAFYSNLPRGQYRFHVKASNDRGVWNEVGDAIAFSIAPAIYERAWFPILCLLPVALALWGWHRLRLARLSARLNLQMEGQRQERKRIAQELHDTLLQGFTGVGLKLEAIATQLPDSLATTRDHLREILNDSDEYLDEARRAVWELRSPSLMNGDFPAALASAAERSLKGTGIELRFTVHGVARQCPSAVEDHLLRIAQEATANAVKHAAPTKVTIHLEYKAGEVRLSVCDDGRGFDPDGNEAIRAGHFGLAGIRERVEALGGQLLVKSEIGNGTQIVATLFS